MDKKTFFEAYYAADVAFEKSIPEYADGVFTSTELKAVCARAKNYLNDEVYAHVSGEFIVAPQMTKQDADDNFAGFVIKYIENGAIVHENSGTFNLGAQNINVVFEPGINV